MSEHDYAGIKKILAVQMRALGYSEPADYVELLSAHSSAAEREWQTLLGLLTNGESYFFRDPDQFSLLKNHLLPAIIERQKTRHAMRIWCAGCSAGEEPYSLAILLHELLEDRENWNLHILATDINEKVIERAKTGRFSPWSLRSIIPEVKERYFSDRDDCWILDERIRRMVTFRRENLIEDDMAGDSLEFENLDLILCRNVFIYFHGEAIAKTMRRFARLLKNDGYLITGHAELLAEGQDIFQPRTVGEQVYFQKKRLPRELTGDPRPAISGKPAEVAHRGSQRIPGTLPSLGRVVTADSQRKFAGDAPPQMTGPDNGARHRNSDGGTEPADVAAELAVMQADLDQSRFASVVTRGNNLLKQAPENSDVYVLMAQAFADMGDYDNADHMCRMAMELQPDAPLPPFLQAQAMEARGRHQEAKRLLKRAIYLAPDFVPAVLELGKLYARENDDKRARTMFMAALELLKDGPVDRPLPPFKGISAGDLILHIEGLLLLKRYEVVANHSLGNSFHEGKE